MMECYSWECWVCGVCSLLGMLNRTHYRTGSVSEIRKRVLEKSIELGHQSALISINGQHPGMML